MDANETIGGAGLCPDAPRRPSETTGCRRSNPSAPTRRPLRERAPLLVEPHPGVARPCAQSAIAAAGQLAVGDGGVDLAGPLGADQVLVRAQAMYTTTPITASEATCRGQRIEHLAGGAGGRDGGA